jgi:outer membrane protein OmpA-like peptidoglycan-associated protein
MKKLLISIFVALIFVSGCRKKPVNKQQLFPVEINKTQFDDKVSPKKVKKLFIDEGDELESFVLEDDQAFDHQGYPVLQLKEETHQDWMGQQEENKQALKTIYFDFDSSLIRPDQQQVLDENLEKIRKLTEEGKTIIVEGHACKYAGDAEYNMMLSDRRAQTVTNYLLKKGIPARALKTVGRGFEMCVIENGSMEEHAINRRVEFHVQD